MRIAKAIGALSVFVLVSVSFGQTDPHTGLPADGSEEARRVMPGVVMSVEEEDVPLIEVREKNINGEWVTSQQPLTATGRIRESGEVLFQHTEEVPLGTAIDSGVLKNAGPETLQVELLLSGGMETYTLVPGEGVAIGTTFPEALLTTHEVSCKCQCSAPGKGSETITVKCINDEDDPVLPSECECEGYNGSPSTQTDGDQATTSSCEATLNPVDPAWGDS